MLGLMRRRLGRLFERRRRESVRTWRTRAVQRLTSECAALLETIRLRLLLLLLRRHPVVRIEPELGVALCVVSTRTRPKAALLATKVLSIEPSTLATKAPKLILRSAVSTLLACEAEPALLLPVLEPSCRLRLR